MSLSSTLDIPGLSDWSIDISRMSMPAWLFASVQTLTSKTQAGRIYFQGNHLDSQSKRKASALDQNSMKESKKHMDVESMKQERHCMAMWQDVRAELKKLREELKEETDAEVLAELKSDIECLKRKKEEWAKLLGMKEEVVNPSSQSS